MGIATTIDHEHDLLYVRAEGPITFDEIRVHLEEESRAGGLQCRELIDARGYTPAFSTEDVRSIVDLLRQMGRASRLGPPTIITDTDVGFGMLRMLEILIEDVCAIRPFRQKEEAEAWLASTPAGR